MKIFGAFLALGVVCLAQGTLTRVGDSNPFFLNPVNPPDGIPAIYAQLSSADAIARDLNGNIYVTLPSLIRKIDATAGTISTVAGTGVSQIVTGTAEQGAARQSIVSRGGYGSIAIAPDGGLLFLSGSFSGGCLKRFDPGTNTVKVIVGNCTLSSGPIGSARGVVVAPDGTAYVQQTSFPQGIYRVDIPTGAATLIAGGSSAGGSISPDGTPALNAVIDVSAGIAVDSQKNVYFADSQRVRKIDAVSGILSTVAGNNAFSFQSTGDGGLATQASLYSVASIAVNSAGDILIGETGRIRLVRKNTGIIDTIAGIGQSSVTFNGDNLLAKDSAISTPKSIVLNGDDVIFLDQNNAYRVRKISGVTGRITTLAGGVAGNGDGGYVSGAVFSGIQSMVADKAGNIFLNDYSTIRRIDKVTNLINTFAGGGSNSTDGATGKDAYIQPSNLVFDSQGNLLFTNGSQIRKLDALARLGTVAGTTTSAYSGDGKYAIQASFSSNMGDLVVDSRGNIVVADTGNCRVRRIDYVSNLVTTIAGNGDCLGQPVEGAATQSPMRPVDLAIGQNDDVYINTGNNIWRVDSTGLLHTFAGNGFNVEGGDGGNALTASFNALEIMFDRGQNLLIIGDNRIRHIDKGTNVIQTVAGGGAQSLSSTGVSALTASFTPNSTVEDGKDLLAAASEGLFRLSPYVVPPLSQPPSSFVFRDPTNLRVEGLNPGSILSLTGNYLAPEEGWGTANDTGQLTKSIKGVRVFMGDPVPLLYVSPSVIHLVMPTSFSLGKVRVETPYGSQLVQPTFFNGNPGVSIFPTPILNPDGSSNGPLNPARSGDVLTMFATNVGPVTPEVRDGTIIRQAPDGSLPTYVRPISAKFTSLSGSNSLSTVVSASPATGYISELARLSIRVPNGLPTGPASLSAAATLLSITTFGQPVTVYITSNVTSPKNPPQILSISPKIIDPLILQSITITGTGFEPNLYLQLYLNGKADRVVSGSAISAITSTSFNADVLLDSAGTWEFEVVTPSEGRSSSKIVVVVPERRSGRPADDSHLRTRQ